MTAAMTAVRRRMMPEAQEREGNGQRLAKGHLHRMDAETPSLHQEAETPLPAELQDNVSYDL